MKAVIFDMDGVLINSEPLHFKVEQMAFNRLGIPADMEELESYVGMTNPDMWSRVKEKHNLEASLEELIEWQVQMKLNELQQSAEGPIDGVPELLGLLKDRRIAVGLASSSPKSFILAVLDKLGIAEYFSAVVSGEEVGKGKPAPDVYLRAAALLGVAPTDCVAVEDSRHGVRAAQAAGMKCIGFQNADSGSQDVSAAEAVVSSIREITPGVLLRLGMEAREND
ncbi:HAD family hydrolase [Paenibacillus doosanensis]|uniref:Beta-phosphoglucomutase n=1 Tax=Paenibacillus konkukensis TaxID=2020716 RepID=A0ABY4RGU6_9BACL|nr:MULTISPECIES: HAD family hydrolase [Paenibacillus]MCS7461071.1 HAD family hydrolase [Paenibacillus doosanensis]UQZ81567.1 Beta-phosphoglucomutase [Paenibacillus konkukensis]